MTEKTKKKKPCETCEIKGYSSYLCRVHYKKAAKDDIPDDCPHNVAIEVGKTAAVGAGVGVAATVVGLAAVPVSVLKVFFAHVMAAKISAGIGGGLTGAGINVFSKTKKEEKDDQKQKKKKKPHFPSIA